MEAAEAMVAVVAVDVAVAAAAAAAAVARAVGPSDERTKSRIPRAIVRRAS